MTPSILLPAKPSADATIALPSGGNLHPPDGASGIAIRLAAIDIDGGFPELAAQSRALFAPLIGQAATLTQAYDAASQVEALYAQAGYVLVRVAIPPQQITPDGILRIVVIDGFVEALDVTGVPAKLQRPVRESLAHLVDRRHVRLGDIERALLLAGDTPGTALRSTLARGETAGGTRLVIDADHDPISVNLAARNDYDPSLGRWGFSTELALNSLLGRGEVIYGFAASDFDAPFADGGHVRVLGGGAAWRFAHSRLSLNPELTVSRTRPDPVPGAPRTVGTLHRYTLRGGYVVARSRHVSGTLTLAVERLDVRNTAVDFGIDLSHDRYLALRAGGAFAWNRSGGGLATLSFQFSQGLGNLAARSGADVATEHVPYSRDGASNAFSDFQASARMQWALGSASQLALSLRGQTSFGRPLLRTEQFSLEGDGALSAYVGGATAVDSGLVGRAELAHHLGWAWLGSTQFSPYVFTAAGTGRIERPSTVEPGAISAVSIGGGTRATLAGGRLSLSAEYAYAYSDFKPLSRVQRLGVSIGLNI